MSCGIIALTVAAEFALHLIGNLPRIAPAQASQQAREIHQIRDTEKRPPLAEDDLRVWDSEVCPFPRNRTNRLIVNAQEESPTVAVIALPDADQRLPAQWMEGMRQPHKMCRSGRTVCILN